MDKGIMSVMNEVSSHEWGLHERVSGGMNGSEPSIHTPGIRPEFSRRMESSRQEANKPSVSVTSEDRFAPVPASPFVFNTWLRPLFPFLMQL
jgi:hypothetical protein